MARQSIAELVTRFEQLGSENAYVFRRGLRTLRWSYAQAALCARRFASELERRDVQPGERVMLWAPNSAEWVSAFLGCAWHGAVAVPMDESAAPDFAQRVANDVGARLIICARQRSTQIAGGFPTLAVEELAQVVAANNPSLTPYPSSRADTLEIVFTSGTTSDPRGVVLTHGNVLANLEPLEREIARYLRYERWAHPVRLLNLLPLSHVFGQFLGLFVPQALRATVVFHDTPNSGEVIRLIRNERVSATICVPRMLQTLRQKIEADLEARGELDRFRSAFDRSDDQHFLRRWWRFRRVHREFGWRFCAFICGGAALDEETEQFWSRMAFAVVQGYGLTETTSLISVNNPFHIGRRSIGRLLPGQEVKLAPDGEILVRGENISGGYWQSNRLQPGAVDNGWFHTGDLGEIDSTGHLFFKGRKKNLIVTAAGMNIHPEDLEAAIKREPGVRDCVVVGVPVSGDTEPCAILLLSPEANADSVIRAANEHLADFQRLRRWKVWPESDFPRTPTLKPRLAEIENFARRSTNDEAPVSRDSELAPLVHRIQGGNSAISPDSTLDSLNLSSLDRVELLSAIEDRYQVDLSEHIFTEATTLADLERQLRAESTSSTPYFYPRWPLLPAIRALRSLVYYALTFPATLLQAKPCVRGSEHLKALHGPALVVCNHVTYIDIGFILYALPPRLATRLVVAMGGARLMQMRQPPKELNVFARFMQRLGYYLVVSLFNVFPLPQNASFRQSFEFAGHCVDTGYSVLIFPEGHCTENGELDRFQVGAGILAERLNIPVLPLRIDGLWEAAQSRRHFLRPGEIVIHIGHPVQYKAGENPSSIAKDLHRRVKALGSDR
mgnify:CR=1 FL=1